MRALVAWLAVALTLPLSLAVPQAAQAASRIDGTWKGGYDCAQGTTQLTLTLKDSGNGDLTGDFQFRVGEVYGSYRLKGVITSNGELKLNPTTWITRPEGYEMVGLAGRAYDRSSEGKPDALYGDVTEAGCGKFAVERQ